MSDIYIVNPMNDHNYVESYASCGVCQKVVGSSTPTEQSVPNFSGLYDECDDFCGVTGTSSSGGSLPDGNYVIIV